MDDLEPTETERLRARVKLLEAQVDLLQRILAEYISNPKPVEPSVKVDAYKGDQNESVP